MQRNIILSLFVLCSFFSKSYCQLQRTFFDYQTTNPSSPFQIINTQSTALWYSNNAGTVLAVDTLTNTEKELRINDSIAIRQIIAYHAITNESGFVFVKDSAGAVYLCKNFRNELTIIHQFYDSSPYYTEQLLLYSFQGENVIFIEDKKLYGVKNDKIVLLKDFSADIPTGHIIDFYVKVGDKLEDWIVVFNKNFYFSGELLTTNKFVESSYDFYFSRSKVYVANQNNLWLLTKKNNKLTEENIANFKNKITITQRADSLLLSVMNNTGTTEETYQVIENKLKLVKERTIPAKLYNWTWENDDFRLVYFNSYHNSDFYVQEKKGLLIKWKSNYYFDYYSGVYFSAPKQIQLKDKTVIQTTELSKGINYYFSFQYKNDTLFVESFREIYPESKLLEYGNYANGFYTINKETFEIKQLYLFKTSTIQVPVLPSNPQFFIGNKNLAYAFDYGYGKKNVINNFRTNQDVIHYKPSIPSENDRINHYFINDSLIVLPAHFNSSFQGYFKITDSKNLYTFFGIQHDSLVLLNNTTKKIEVQPSPFKEEKIKLLYVVNFNEFLISTTDNELFLLKNGVKTVLRKADALILPFMVENETYFLEYKDKINSIYLLKNGTTAVLKQNFTFKPYEEKTFVTDLRIVSKSIIQLLVYNNNLTVALLKIEKQEFTEIPQFWKDEYRTNTDFIVSPDGVTIFASNNGKLYSSAEPLKALPTIDYFNGIYSINAENDLYWFDSKPMKYISKTKQQWVLKNRVHQIHYNYHNKMIFEAYAKNDNKTRYFYEIDSNRVHKLNTKPIYNQLNMPLITENGTFVWGKTLDNNLPQLYELVATETTDLEWILAEEKKTPPIVEEEELVYFGTITAYPNPFRYHINFKLVDVPGIYHIGIYNQQGQTVSPPFAVDYSGLYYEMYSDSSVFLPSKTRREAFLEQVQNQLMNLPPGIYYVRFYFDPYLWSKSTTVKIIKL